MNAQHLALEPDRAFCAELLPQVSRTFALSIALLPEALREPVSTAYLLCRLVDTIEDDASLSPPVRRRLFSRFDDLVSDDELSPSLFVGAARAVQLGATEPERRLAAEADRVFRVFRALPAEDREDVRPWLLEMSCGMRAYAERAIGQGGRLQTVDLEDLERYCWFVAGTVGGLLTALFRRAVPHGVDPLALERAAGRFGTGLQLVNIVKDAAQDAERGACFLPRDLLLRRGVAPDALLDPAGRRAALEAVREVVARARQHLEEAGQYTLAWPGPEGAEVRLFCTVPLLLAHATLREVEHETRALRSGEAPKVDRSTVLRALEEAQAAVGDDQALARLLQRWAA
jgi:farnesyl-diphosphate farnesyltransferase